MKLFLDASIWTLFILSSLAMCMESDDEEEAPEEASISDCLAIIVQCLKPTWRYLVSYVNTKVTRSRRHHPNKSFPAASYELVSLMDNEDFGSTSDVCFFQRKEIPECSDIEEEECDVHEDIPLCNPIELTEIFTPGPNPAGENESEHSISSNRRDSYADNNPVLMPFRDSPMHLVNMHPECPLKCGDTESYEFNEIAERPTVGVQLMDAPVPSILSGADTASDWDLSESKGDPIGRTAEYDSIGGLNPLNEAIHENLGALMSKHTSSKPDQTAICNNKLDSQPIQAQPLPFPRIIGVMHKNPSSTLTPSNPNLDKAGRVSDDMRKLAELYEPRLRDLVFPRFDYQGAETSGTPKRIGDEQRKYGQKGMRGATSLDSVFR